MLSKNKCKFINSLRIKKFREIHELFIAEGEKLVTEIINSEFQISSIISTSEWFEKNHQLLQVKSNANEIIKTKLTEIKKISELISIPEVIAIVKIPKAEFKFDNLTETLTLVLDEVQNPGNLGTIIRIADWFGINNIICSPYCADNYNSKVVQATMGSICRVKLFYYPLIDLLKKFENVEDFQIYGTFLKGENIYQTNLVNKGLIIMGNEGTGISQEIVPFIKKRIYIPSYPSDNSRSESLNVATAASIVCSEFRRRLFLKIKT